MHKITVLKIALHWDYISAIDSQKWLSDSVWRGSSKGEWLNEIFLYGYLNYVGGLGGHLHDNGRIIIG